MGRGNAEDMPPEGAARRGLSRLMLRLPAVRGQMQSLTGRSEALESLCEAYEDACVALERMMRDAGPAEGPLVSEYQTICVEIETDVLHYCVFKKGIVPE